MFEKFLHIKYINYVFYVFVLCYAFIIVFNANFGIIDDHTLTQTLLVGKNIDWHIFREIGRFFPLNAQEYNLISHISISPVAFYMYNALQFMIVVFLLFSILKKLLSDYYNNLIYIVILFLILTPAFITSWFRLFVPERNVFFFLLLFIFFYIKFQDKQKISLMLYGIVTVNMALYYKEPVFVMIATFASMHLFFGWKTINLKQKIFDLALLLSTVIWGIIYYITVFQYKGDTLYGDTNLDFMQSFLKNIFNYFLSDPFIFTILIPIIVYRFWQLIVGKDKFNIIMDSLLFSSSIYILVLLKLNIFAYHYMLPIYAFGIFSSIFYLIKLNESKLLSKKCAIIVILFFFLSSIPMGVYLISFYKNTNTNFQATISFLNSYLNNQDQRVNIFIDGVNRGSGHEIYNSYKRFLEYKGIRFDKFNLRTTELDDEILSKKKYDEDSPYTVFSENVKSSISSNDLLILSTYSKYGFSEDRLLEYLKSYDLIYQSKSSFIEIPNLSLKSQVKYLIHLIKQNEDNNLFESTNFNGLPFDFYVLRKK